MSVPDPCQLSASPHGPRGAGDPAAVRTHAPPCPPGWRLLAARSPLARARGLIGRAGLPGQVGLWLPVRSVHTVGMRFPIDLVWLSGAGDVLRIDEGIGRGRLRTCLRAGGGVVELEAGRGRALAGAIHRTPGSPPRTT